MTSSITKVATSLASAYRNPEVRGYFQEKQEADKQDKERKSMRLPYIGAGLLGAGYGLHKLGENFITPQDRSTVEDLIGLGGRINALKPAGGGSLKDILFPPTGPHKEFAGSPELFYDYIDRASRASKVKLWGHDVVDILHKIKPALGFKEEGPGPNATPAQLDFHAENMAHYPAFQAGPVDAYVHQLRKLVKDPSWDISWPNHFLKDKTTGEMPVKDPKVFMATLEDRMNDFLMKDKGVALTNAKLLPHGEQMDALRRFGGSLQHVDPTLAKAKDVIERNSANMQPDAAGWYANGGRAALSVFQDAPKAMGVGLGALGTGALAYWLINRLRGVNKPKAPTGWKVQAPARKRRGEEKQAAMLNLAASKLNPSLALPQPSLLSRIVNADPFGAKARATRVAQQETQQRAQWQANPASAPANPLTTLHNKIWPTIPTSK